MKLKNTWIEKEQDLLKKDLKMKKRYRTSDTQTMMGLIALIATIVVFSYASAESIFECPHCFKPIEAKRTWGETWICPKETCQYENYDGINSCGICGTSRYAKPEDVK